MIPFIVLVSSFTLFLILGRVGVTFFRPWLTCLRWALAAMFLLTASAHWGSRRDDLIRMVPPAMPNPELLVTITGIAEIAGAVGLLIPRFAPAAATGLALLLIAVFPANVYAAAAGAGIDGRAPTPIVLRGALQALFLSAVVIASGVRPGRRRRAAAA